MSHYLLRQNAVDLQRSTQIGYKQIPRAKSRHIKKSRVECAWNNKNIPVSKNTQDDLSRACADFYYEGLQIFRRVSTFPSQSFHISPLPCFHLPLSKLLYFLLFYPLSIFPPTISKPPTISTPFSFSTTLPCLQASLVFPSLYPDIFLISLLPPKYIRFLLSPNCSSEHLCLSLAPFSFPKGTTRSFPPLSPKTTLSVSTTPWKSSVFRVLILSVSYRVFVKRFFAWKPFLFIFFICLFSFLSIFVKVCVLFI